MNIQNIPKKDTVVKRSFLPKQDALLFFDYKQIEPRLLGYYMAETPAINDRRLVDWIQSGVDPYTAIVYGLYGREDITDEERDRGKRLFLSLQYGGGLNTITKQWNVSYPEAKRILNEFNAAWPGIKQLNDLINAMVQERGYALSLAGRHLRPESEHKAVNSLCQGGGAEIMRMALLKVNRFLNENLLASHLVLSIHDELVLDCVEREIPMLAERVPALMDYEPVSRVVPIPVDVEITRTTWADKTEYEEVALAA